MPLAALGLMTIVLGIGLEIPGLTGAGGLWIVLGLAVRWHNRRIEAVRKQNIERAAHGEIITKGAVTNAKFALGLALVAAVGLPSLAIGILAIGIPDTQVGWRWLPIGVGAVALLLVFIALATSAAGIRASASEGGVSELPVLATIRGLRETSRTINERPVVEVDLYVECDRLPSYEITERVTVPHVALNRVRVGEVLEGVIRAGEERPKVRFKWDDIVNKQPPTQA